eukprot:TRINITY_DN6135_c0_g1_i2.p1 TRINITY_DN6135_c0_g1~~TRINITY_DN6135_c0_g1_i2.p1  ORF type:complete len:135 (+),score=10.55 TRINITY_DN6135_c0_g1_i2:22-426(+)
MFYNLYIRQKGSQACICYSVCYFFFFQAEDGIRDHAQSRGLGDVYKRQDKSNVKSVFDIYDNASLLRKVLMGEATETEKLRAEDLLTLHPELKEQYDELCRRDGLNHSFIRYNHYSSKDAYSRFLRKVGPCTLR